MNGYVCFYKEKRLEVYAPTMLDAREKAERLFGVAGKKAAWMVSVNLAEVAGRPVIHSGTEY